MKKFFRAMLSVALLASASTAAADMTVTFNPAADTQTEFPATFTMTFDDTNLTSIQKNMLGNVIVIQEPGASNVKPCTGVSVSGKVLNVTTNTSVDRTKKGNYIIRLLAAEGINNGLVFNYADGSKVNSAQTDYIYTIAGQGGTEPGTGEDEVYNVKLIKMQPNTSPTDPTVDIANKKLKSCQLTFNLDNLQVAEGATVRIKGPGYNQIAAIKFGYGWPGFGTPTTTMLASFGADPVYNGTYTLSIPQGIVGTEAYLADNETGHANAAQEYVFECIGGKDVSEMTIDTSLGIIPSIPLESEVETFDDLTFKFEEKVYFNENTRLTVKRMTNLQATSYSAYGTASLTRVSDTEVKLTIDPTPEATSDMHDYLIIVPQGTFWNEAHQLDRNAGLVNGASEFNWYLIKDVVMIEVTGHTPASDDSVDGFATGSGITFNTSDDTQVAKLVMTMKKYDLENDMDAGTTVLNNVTSTAKNADGAPCWINEGEFLSCDKGYWYEVSAMFYNENDDEIGSCTFEFFGNSDGEPVEVDTFELTPSIEDKATVESLEDLAFTFEGKVYFDEAAEMSVTAEDYEGKATLVRKSNTEIRVKIEPMPEATETAKEYTLTVPQGIFWDKEYELYGTGSVNAAATYTWTLVKEGGNNGTDGVEAIEAAEGAQRIYNTQGVRVNAAVETLPAGLYIIDGQKVMIRK